MTSVDEAYLPLNLYSFPEATNESTIYLKEIYSIVDSEPLDDIHVQNYNPEVLKTQCQLYKDQMEKYAIQFKSEQEELLACENKLNTLQTCKDKIKSVCNDEGTLQHITNLMDLLEIEQSERKTKHIQTAKEYKYLFSIGPHFTNNDPKHLCPICVNNEIDTAIVPCGHTLCSKCSLKCDLSLCYICRNPIEKVIKLYYI